MSGYKIFGDSISGNCLKVKWTADYLRIPYDWVEISVLRGETRTPEFLAMNAAAQVPVIVTPAGDAIAQSNAIILYLAENDSGGRNPGLIPPDPLDRAKMYEWLFWEQYSHEPYIAVRRFQKTYLKKTDDEIDPKLMERGLGALTRMDAVLSSSRWVAGAAFTLADVSLLAYTRVAHEGGFDLNAFPGVEKWVRDASRHLGLEAA